MQPFAREIFRLGAGGYYQVFARITLSVHLHCVAIHKSGSAFNVGDVFVLEQKTHTIDKARNHFVFAAHHACDIYTAGLCRHAKLAGAFHKVGNLGAAA